MNRLERSRTSHEAAWEYLSGTLGADIALVQEADPPEHFKNRVYRPIDEHRYNWGSAVVAIGAGLRLRERTRVALADCYLDAIAEGELPDSCPGACAVADVETAEGEVLCTAVSLYGQWEMRPGGKTMDACPRVHRMLSDLTAVLASSRNRPVIIAGDLNVTTQYPRETPSQSEKDAAESAAVIFSRLNAWGLTSCLEMPQAFRTALADCHCRDAGACRHVQTFRSKNRRESLPAQLDYMFASAACQVGKCWVDNTDTAWSYSDHCPILLEVLDAR